MSSRSPHGHRPFTGVLLLELSRAWDLLEKAASRVWFGAEEGMGSLPTQQQRSISILAWLAVYFSLT